MTLTRRFIDATSKHVVYFVCVHLWGQFFGYIVRVNGWVKGSGFWETFLVLYFWSRQLFLFVWWISTIKIINLEILNQTCYTLSNHPCFDDLITTSTAIETKNIVKLHFFRCRWQRKLFPMSKVRVSQPIKMQLHNNLNLFSELIYDDLLWNNNLNSSK